MLLFVHFRGKLCPGEETTPVVTVIVVRQIGAAVLGAFG